MPFAIQKITPHITPEVLKNAPDFESVWEDFRAWCTDLRAACEQRFGEDKVGVWLAGHNALVYDMRVLWGNLTRLEIEPVAELAELGVRGVLDTLKLARAREWGAAPPTKEAGGAHDLQSSLSDLV